MIVYKFKGAVLQDPEGLVAIKNRIRENVPCIIVVSALKGVMPRLRALYDQSLKKVDGCDNDFA